MHPDDRFRAIHAAIGKHRRCDCDLAEIEAHLDLLQREVAELLARIPAPDLTPASVTLTAH
jgi:hypothetical protein